jgi:hypothetical protein
MANEMQAPRKKTDSSHLELSDTKEACPAPPLMGLSNHLIRPSPSAQPESESERLLLKPIDQDIISRQPTTQHKQTGSTKDLSITEKSHLISFIFINSPSLLRALSSRCTPPATST